MNKILVTLRSTELDGKKRFQLSSNQTEDDPNYTTYKCVFVHHLVHYNDIPHITYEEDWTDQLL